jgi:hypothetical protein
VQQAQQAQQDRKVQPGQMVQMEALDRKVQWAQQVPRGHKVSKDQSAQRG